METIRTDAMERAAHVPLPPSTLHPTVRTRRYVPTNSEATFFNIVSPIFPFQLV
jgi:hypothetical protein